MATITYIPEKTQNKTAMGKVMRYCTRENKTQYELDGKKIHLISGKDCCAETAFNEYMATKQQYGKANGMFFYQYVQSFSPNEKVSPQTAHEIGCKFAEYFKGHEVLIATHTDRKHLHTHFIINSVNNENGKKLQMARGSIHKLRQFSDEICRQYSLSIVEPKQKSGIKTREYRAAIKGDSWKFKLINAIDNAMENSQNKEEFFANMNKMGYQVIWQNNLKYITYTTPDGMKCRDNKLHDDKYLKENMEVFYELRHIKGFEQAGKHDRRISYQIESVRNPTGYVRADINASVGDSSGTSTHAETNQSAAELAGYQTRVNADTRQHELSIQQGNRGKRKTSEMGIAESDERFEINSQGNDNEQYNGTGANAQGEGFESVENPNQVGITGRDVAAAVLGAALVIENLVNHPEEQQKKKYVPKAEKQHKHEKNHRPTHDHEWEMER